MCNLTSEITHPGHRLEYIEVSIYLFYHHSILPKLIHCIVRETEVAGGLYLKYGIRDTGKKK